MEQESRKKKIQLEKKDAYLTVLNDLMECDLFVGRYDAKNGKEDFMYGICTVMDAIADRAGLDYFESLFYENMQRSKDKAKKKMDEISPATCGQSLKMNGVGPYICRLECTPCPRYSGKECVMTRMKKALDTALKPAQEDPDEE